MKLGIVGNGGIVQVALEALKKSDIEVCALWCRNESKGKVIVEQYNIHALYTNYDTFLKDDSFDTVYIGLINSLHYEYAKKALLAKKHVIVEKPFTSSEEEAIDLYTIAITNGCYLFEAIMSRYSENYEALKQHLNDIGDIKAIQCNYAQYSRRYDAYLKGEVLPAFDPMLSGGALYDINVYNVHFLTGLFGMPVNSMYMANLGYNGIDTSGSLLMQYFHCVCTCIGAKDCSGENGVLIEGTKGYIRIPERPGFVKNVTVYTKDNSYCIDVKQEDNPMLQQFTRIQEVLDASEHDVMQRWLDCSLFTMRVLEKSRKDAHLQFACDLK